MPREQPVESSSFAPTTGPVDAPIAPEAPRYRFVALDAAAKPVAWGWRAAEVKDSAIVAGCPAPVVVELAV